MNRIQYTLSLSVILFICFSCKPPRQEVSQNLVEETAIRFCESFYNLNYPVAKEWVTDSSLFYLRFLASNVRQEHLDEINKASSAEAIVVSSEIDSIAGKATVVCSVRNASLIRPLTGDLQQIGFLQDTLRLIEETGKWLIRKDIPQQSGKQSHD